jgi:hypothetical protein
MSDHQQFKITPLLLNFRSEPKVKSNNILAVLPQGQVVTKLEAAGNEKWWKVATVFRQNHLEGYVARRFLTPISEFTELPGYQTISPVHLKENRADVKRNWDGRRAFPLGEPDRPTRKSSDPAAKAAELTTIIRWLDVEKSLRYKRKTATTYCNIYTYDYCYLAGVYLPRVWWKASALVQLAAGEEVTPRYDETLTELNANSLYDWLDDFGEQFGWTRHFDLTKLQKAANAGEVVVICAQRKNLNYSGHICVIVPETQDHKAEWGGDEVKKPLQSQAGAKNYRYSTRIWWTSTKYRKFGFWKHE